MNNPANRFFPKSERNLKKTNINTVSAVLILFLLFGCISPSFAQQQLKISDGEFSKKLPQIPSRNIEYVSDGVIVTYTFTDVLSMQAENKGRFFWKIPGFGTLSDEGFPMIPNRVDAFTIDENHDVKLTVLEEEYTDYVVEMAAAGPIKTDLSIAQPVKEFSEMQQFKGFYPKETVSEMETEFYRGRPIFKFMVCPVQYSQKEKLTRFYTKLKYKITYTESSKKRASASELTKQLPTLEENSIYERIGIPLIKPNENIKKAIGLPQTSEPGKKLFILTNRTLLPAANRLAEWKRCLGYDVFVSAAPSHRTSEQVKQVIQNRYDTEGIDYLLIIGDQDVITGKEYYANSGEVEETNTQWTPYYLSDHYYVCMDGDNDYFPDIHKGRIPSHNLEEAYNAVNKIIRYEKNPPSDPSFYKNGINLAQLQLLDPNSNTEYKETYRFIFTSENIRNYLIDNYNLNIERVYATHNTLTTLKPFKYNAQYCYDGVYNPNNIDVINYELMPDELQNLDVWKKTTEACGTFYPYLWNKPSFLFYSGHGDVDRWGCPGILVDPHLRKHGVFTVIKYPVMLFSICCQNGKYNLPNCFISEWINNKSGAVGAFAATHFTYILDQLAQVELMMNCIWPKDFINFAYGSLNRTETYPSTNDDYVSVVYPEKFPNGMTMGEVLDESINLVPNVTCKSNASLNYHRKVTHYFGDPTMRWYIENPGTFTPSYWESGNDIVFSGNRPNTIIAVYDTQTNEVTRHHNVDSLKLNKEKAKHCVVTSVGYDIRPWSWIGEEVDLEVLSNQEIIKY
ncbi:MAG: hypothetical protein J6C81_09095 [Muribaculaceae bacterium]|nr:hypothetical protein [Muribaculaceae bacterium]